MKKILSIFAVSFLMLGMIACDKIDEGEYFKPNNESNDTIPLSIEDINNWRNEKVVLLEDFTGVKCVNCPDAAIVAHELQEQYGHQLVVLGVHAGWNANPMKDTTYFDFRTEEGEEWNKFFNFMSNPIGTINRQNNGSSYGYAYGTWPDEVEKAIAGTPNIRLLLAPKYNEKDRELKVTVYSKFLDEFSDKYNLTVCLMEDNIVGKQAGTNGGENYLHRHVFRGTLNGAWGTELNDATITTDTEIIKNYSITLDEKFNADNCYIVAYVYLRDSKEILQVIEKKIK